jgi:hypothetical protein
MPTRMVKLSKRKRLKRPVSFVKLSCGHMVPADEIINHAVEMLSPNEILSLASSIRSGMRETHAGGRPRVKKGGAVRCQCGQYTKQYAEKIGHACLR